MHQLKTRRKAYETRRLIKLLVTSLLLCVLLLPVFAGGTIPKHSLDDNKKQTLQKY